MAYVAVSFYKKNLVLDSKAAIAAKVVQPFTPQFFNTHQKIQFNATLANVILSALHKQVKVVILQNTDGIMH